MQVRGFFAADMRQAMKRVRNEPVAGGIELATFLDAPLQRAAPVRLAPALEAELRLAQVRIAEAHARLTTSAGPAGQARQIIGEAPLPEAPVKPMAVAVDPRTFEGKRWPAAASVSRNSLVLAATSQRQAFRVTWYSYRRCLADGPQIPDDLHLPHSHQRVNRAVSLQTSEAPSEGAMADLFADFHTDRTRQAG